MPVQVLIPTPLQKFTNDEASVSLDASSVDGLIDALDGRYPGLKGRLCDEAGKLRRFLNVYVNSEDIRFLENQTTPPQGWGRSKHRSRRRWGLILRCSDSCSSQPLTHAGSPQSHLSLDLVSPDDSNPRSSISGSSAQRPG